MTLINSFYFSYCLFFMFISILYVFDNLKTYLYIYA